MPLTQELIAELVGVRRESVTMVAGTLQTAGIIRYHRGRITVLDRPALAQRACACHAAIKRELRRGFARPGAHTLPPAVIAHRLALDFAAVANSPVGILRATPHAKIPPRVPPYRSPILGADAGAPG